MPAPPRASRAVLVTGCSTGIGRATALRLAEAGWPVYATARRVESLVTLRHDLIQRSALDVTDDDSMTRTVETICAAHGAVGVLINNAGYSQSGAVETVSIAKCRDQFETNVFGPLRLIQLVAPGMRAQGWGKIVNVSSMGGRFTLPGGGVYHASKHAMEALSDALRFELRGFGINVILVEPGLIRTEFSAAAVASIADRADAPTPYDEFEKAVARLTVESYHRGPLSRLAGTAEDVADVIRNAVETARPRSRYRVTASAHVLLGLRRLLPDALWDAFLRTSYPTPTRR